MYRLIRWLVCYVLTRILFPDNFNHDQYEA
jgi:hypothetical protein